MRSVRCLRVKRWCQDALFRVLLIFGLTFAFGLAWLWLIWQDLRGEETQL